MKYFILLFVFVILGCATSHNQTAKSDPQLRIIDNKIASDCTFIGVFTGDVKNPFQLTHENISDAKSRAFQKASMSGADSAVITSVSDNKNSATVTIGAYRCGGSVHD